MEFILEYIKKNTKYAAKSVFRNFKEYLPFFAALFVILCVFFTIFISKATNSYHEEASLREDFDYDVCISGLTDSQKLSVERSLYIQSFMKRRSFESHTIEKAPELEGGDYRVYLVMREDAELNFFMKEHIYGAIGAEAPNIKVSTTPLYDYKTSSSSSNSPSLLLIILMCAISVAALVAIYSIRVNNQKFLYGIYITFGADLKKLISTAVFEMMILALLAYIPAFLTSFLLSYLIYAPFSTSPVITTEILLKVLASIFVISLVGSYLPMKLVSRKTPLSLLSADDNSNLVTSPSRSVNMLTKSFPNKYEFISLFRFRKYYIKLILSSVIFTSVFICGFYLSSMFNENINAPIKEFSFTNTSEYSEEEQLDDIDFLYDRISAIENVESVTWNVDTRASEISSLAILQKKNRHSSDGLYALLKDTKCIDEEMQPYIDKFEADEFNSVVNAYKYTALNENSIKYIKENFKIEGDIDSILNDPDRIIVSEDIYNKQRFDFKVGDKIIIGKFIAVNAAYEGDYFDNVGVLRHMISSNTYEFKEYTVGAVIKNYGDNMGCFTIGMNDANYTYITGRSAVPKEASISLSANTTVEEANSIHSELTPLFYYMGSDYNLSRSYESSERDILRAEALNSFSVALSSLVVIMSPVVWFFSQTMFTKKRAKELYVLRAFGAKEKDISRMFSYSGGVMAVMGFVFATLLSLPASYLIYMTMNSWLPSLGFIKSSLNYSFSLSPVAVIICALLSTACGFLSAYIPYKLEIKAERIKQKKINTEGSDT